MFSKSSPRGFGDFLLLLASNDIFLLTADDLDPVRAARPPSRHARAARTPGPVSHPPQRGSNRELTHPRGPNTACHTLTGCRARVPHVLAGSAPSRASSRAVAAARRRVASSSPFSTSLSTLSRRRAAAAAVRPVGLLPAAGRRFPVHGCSGDRRSHQGGRGRPRCSREDDFAAVSAVCGSGGSLEGTLSGVQHCRWGAQELANSVWGLPIHAKCNLIQIFNVVISHIFTLLGRPEPGGRQKNRGVAPRTHAKPQTVEISVGKIRPVAPHVQ